jgi:hypothetical protein
MQRGQFRQKETTNMNKEIEKALNDYADACENVGRFGSHLHGATAKDKRAALVALLGKAPAKPPARPPADPEA